MSTHRSILLVGDAGPERDAALEVLKGANGGGKIRVMGDHAAALKLIATAKVDCVFCYARSGPEASVTFLTEVWHRLPSCGRFVIAPAIDAETQIRCAFGAHHYLPLPLNPKQVQAALDLAEGKEAILPSDRVQLLIARMRSLPSKPTIYFEVLRELESSHGDATRIAELIQRDPGIASKVIQVVNSIFYGRAQAVHDMKEAVLFLGFEVTASIVLSLEAISRFEKAQPFPELADRIWAHSQTVAELSRKICQVFGRDCVACDQAFLTGLLHDIGQLVLAQNFPKEYRQVLRQVSEQHRSLLEIEKELLGVSHADAGAYLLAVWGLPVAMFKSVAQHHAPAEKLGSELSIGLAVHLAEEILETENAVEEIISKYPGELGLAKLGDTIAAFAPRAHTEEPPALFAVNGHNRLRTAVPA